jgi:hypothetical protein
MRAQPPTQPPLPGEPRPYPHPQPPTRTSLPGEPLKLDDVTCRCDSSDPSEQQEAWRLITERVRVALQDLEQQCPPNPDQTANAPTKGPPPS